MTFANATQTSLSCHHLKQGDSIPHHRQDFSDLREKFPACVRREFLSNCPDRIPNSGSGGSRGRTRFTDFPVSSLRFRESTAKAGSPSALSTSWESDRFGLAHCRRQRTVASLLRPPPLSTRQQRLPARSRIGIEKIARFRGVLGDRLCAREPETASSAPASHLGRRLSLSPSWTVPIRSRFARPI
jgi:hypothetical protein